MERYCVLKENEVIDLNTGFIIPPPLNKLHLINGQIFFFDRRGCNSLISVNQELNNLPEIERLRALQTIVQINVLNMQVSTDYRNFDEVMEGLQFSEDNYFPIVNWIKEEFDLKQKYLNLLFYRREYWDKILAGEHIQTTPWSVEMLNKTTYGLIDEIYNEPFPVETVEKSTFYYLDRIPEKLKKYFQTVFIDRNFDEPELAAEYTKFIKGPIRVQDTQEFKKFNFFGMELRLNRGGLHYNADDYFERDIKLIDFKAYYPNLMVRFDLQSRRIADPEQKRYLKQWIKIRNDLSDPVKQDKIPAPFKKIKNKFKIFQSSLYGCLRDTNITRKSHLYDPITGLALTFTGQWIMLAFIKQLKPFIKRIYGINTDGLFLEWKDEMEDGQYIEQIVSNFYDLTNIRYTYDSFNKCFFFKFNQLLCYKAPVVDKNGLVLKEEVIYAKGDYFKNYNQLFDDDYYITNALFNFYMHHEPVRLETYPLAYFRKTLSLKYNQSRKKRFIFYESKITTLTLEQLHTMYPELFVNLRKISTKFLFDKIEFHKIAKNLPVQNPNLITVVPSIPGPNSYMIRVYNKEKAESYDYNHKYYFYDFENELKVIFEYHDFDNDEANIGWKYRIKYLNAKILRGADYYTIFSESQKDKIDFAFCYKMVDDTISNLSADAFYQKYPELKPENL